MTLSRVTKQNPRFKDTGWIRAFWWISPVLPPEFFVTTLSVLFFFISYGSGSTDSLHLSWANGLSDVAQWPLRRCLEGEFLHRCVVLIFHCRLGGNQHGNVGMVLNFTHAGIGVLLRFSWLEVHGCHRLI